MNDIKVKWLIWTVFIGLVPLFIRLSLYISSDMFTSKISISDLVAFALVMQISTIGGCEQLSKDHSRLKAICNGFSIFFLIISGVYYGISLIAESRPDLFNIDSCTTILVFVCIASTALSYATHDRIYKDTLISKGI